MMPLCKAHNNALPRNQADSQKHNGIDVFIAKLAVSEQVPQKARPATEKSARLVGLTAAKKRLILSTLPYQMLQKPDLMSANRILFFK